MPTLLESLRNDRFFFETKLQLVANFVPFLCFSTNEELISIFENKSEECTAEKLHSSMIMVNMNPLMVRMIIYTLTEKIIQRSPGLTSRIRVL